MLTSRTRIRVPGIFAPSFIVTPSLGCTVKTSWLGWTPAEPSSENAWWGTALRVTAISVTLRESRLPVRR